MIFIIVLKTKLPELDTFRTNDWIKALRDMQYVPILSRFLAGMATTV